MIYLLLVFIESTDPTSEAQETQLSQYLEFIPVYHLIN